MWISVFVSEMNGRLVEAIAGRPHKNSFVSWDLGCVIWWLTKQRRKNKHKSVDRGVSNIVYIVALLKRWLHYGVCSQASWETSNLSSVPWVCPEASSSMGVLPREMSWWLPNQRPEPPHLVPLNMDEQWHQPGSSWRSQLLNLSSGQSLSTLLGKLISALFTTHSLGSFDDGYPLTYSLIIHCFQDKKPRLWWTVWLTSLYQGPLFHHSLCHCSEFVLIL